MNLLTPALKHTFAFFNKQISQKYGKKCCRYGLDGHPLSPSAVLKLHTQLSPLILGWKIAPDYLSLYRYFHTQSYPAAIQYISDIAKLDSEQYKNCPSFSLTKGEILKLQLLSPPLNGLSHLDFEIAMKINQLFDVEKYYLIPVEDPGNFKREVMKRKFERQSREIQKELEGTEGKGEQGQEQHVHTDKCKH